MLTRRIGLFRDVAEVAERLCRDAGVEVHPGLLDALIRRWVDLDTRAWSEAGQSAAFGLPSDLGRLVAEDLIEADRLLRARRSPLTRRVPCVGRPTCSG